RGEPFVFGEGVHATNCFYRFVEITVVERRPPVVALMYPRSYLEVPESVAYFRVGINIPKQGHHRFRADRKPIGPKTFRPPYSSHIYTMQFSEWTLMGIDQGFVLCVRNGKTTK